MICNAISINLYFFFFKQKTAYEMCGRDWSSDVCSSDLTGIGDVLMVDILVQVHVMVHSGLLKWPAIDSKSI